MVPGMIRREWSLGEQRRQELIDEATQHQRLVAACQDEETPHVPVRLRAAARALGPALLHIIANAGLDRGRPRVRADIGTASCKESPHRQLVRCPGPKEDWLCRRQ